MSQSINNVVLVGRLTRDPELRTTGNGTSVTTFTLAVDRQYGKDKQADFISCVAWRKTAELVAQYTDKGHMVGVQGRIQTRSYDDRDGKRVYVTEVVADTVQFIGSHNGQQGQQESTGWSSQPQPDAGKSSPFSGSTPEVSSDDLPF